MYYLLRAKVRKPQGKGHGAVFNTITKETFKQIFVPMPRLTEQKEVAKILLDIDKKIDLNEKMNRTLEAVGEAVFRRWFVDFKFPNQEGKPYKTTGGKMQYNEEFGKEVPADWEIMPLEKVAEFTRGFSYSGTEKSSTNCDLVFITLKYL